MLRSARQHGQAEPRRAASQTQEPEAFFPVSVLSTFTLGPDVHSSAQGVRNDRSARIRGISLGRQ